MEGYVFTSFVCLWEQGFFLCHLIIFTSFLVLFVSPTFLFEIDKEGSKAGLGMIVCYYYLSTEINLYLKYVYHILEA